jgi:hypothetical protein
LASIGQAALAAAAVATTVGEILADPDGFLRQDVQLSGRLTGELPGGEFLFTDGTGEIPMDFNNAPPTPPLNTQIRVFGKVVNGGAQFAAKIEVAAWDDLKKFNCNILTDARARFTDPGFKVGDIVGLYLKYSGVPPGEKILEIVWDEGNPKGDVETFDVGQGVPQGDGLFLLEGVVTHEYPGVTGKETKKVRATLTIAGVDGQCARVRDVTVSPGSGLDEAAGGSLRVTVDNPVKSGKQFDVRATVKNNASRPIDVELIFKTPTDADFDSKLLPPGCTKQSRQIAECFIEGLEPTDGLSKVIIYIAPQVTKVRDISGSVTMAVGEFAPVASYITTVEP